MFYNSYYYLLKYNYLIKVCKKLKIRDWTKLVKNVITPEEAKIILHEVNTEKMNINLEDFRIGLEVELEHGKMYKNSNVTNNHPLITGCIVVAHMKETLDYYKRLDIMELEGDLFKAIKGKNMTKIEEKYKKLIKAKHVLTHVELDSFK